MYGLVNQGVQDLAIQLGGEPLWLEIRAAAGVEHETFVAMGVYPDEITYRLVDAASTILHLTPAEVLHAFGRHWVLYTARRGYGPVLDMMGATLPEFFGNLDAMHARLSLSMPDLKPPSFVCELVNDSRIRLEYWTHRDGLAPMVVGLLMGCGDLFGQAVTVTHSMSRADGADHDEFVIDYLPLDSSISVRRSSEAVATGGA